MQLKHRIRQWVQHIAPLLFTLLFFGGIIAHEITISMQQYSDKTSYINIPGLSILLNPWEGGKLTSSIKFDAISSASEQRVSTSDVVSGASTSENRTLSTLSLNQQMGLWDITISGYYSHEPDYRSGAVSFELKRELFQSNTTLSISGSFGSDTITSTDDVLFNKSATRYGLSIAMSQILSPKIIGRITGSYSRIEGYQSSPYRFALRDGAFPPFDNQETLPEVRNRYAMALRFNFYLSPIRGALHTGYRYYWDDWEVQSHEIFAKIYKYFTDRLIANLQLRYYTQTGAAYYKPVFTQAESYMTTFEKYAPGNTILATLGLQYTLKISKTSGLSFLDGLKLNGEFGIYRRSADKNTGTILQIAVTWKW